MKKSTKTRHDDHLTIELDRLQLKIEDLIFRWTGAGAPIIPSMKDSIERGTKDSELRAYFWEKLRPKFL